MHAPLFEPRSYDRGVQEPLCVQKYWQAMLQLAQLNQRMRAHTAHTHTHTCTHKAACSCTSCRLPLTLTLTCRLLSEGDSSSAGDTPSRLAVSSVSDTRYTCERGWAACAQLGMCANVCASVFVSVFVLCARIRAQICMCEFVCVCVCLCVCVCVCV